MKVLEKLWNKALSKWAVPRSLWVTYGIVYIVLGVSMNALGAVMEIARFTHWGQVLSVYGGYMIPISLLLRGMPVYRQYAFGLVAISLLEFGGYALGTSYAYPGNVLERLFGVRNFSLAMSLFFATYFPLGNGLVGWIYARIDPNPKKLPDRERYKKS